MTRIIRPPVTLRDAVAADVPDVMRLIRGLAAYERKLADFVASAHDIETLLFSRIPRAHAILALLPDQPPVGIALFYYTITSFAGRTGLFLEDLFVEPAHRGSGIGLALLRHLAAKAVAENCNDIEWRVLNWNQPAIDFYERIGATRTEDWHARQLRGPALAALAQGASENG
jgi:GNAT superfamily N-acetyltransferase